jgi:hypothetical protein
LILWRSGKSMHDDRSRRRKCKYPITLQLSSRSPERRSCMRRLPRASNELHWPRYGYIVHLGIRSATQPGVCDEKHRSVTGCTVTDRKTSGF